MVLVLLSWLVVVFSADFCFGMFIIFIFRNECKLRNETNRTQSKTTTKLKTARMATEGEGEVDGEGRGGVAVPHKYAKQLKDSRRSNLGVKCE